MEIRRQQCHHQLNTAGRAMTMMVDPWLMTMMVADDPGFQVRIPHGSEIFISEPLNGTNS